MNKRAAVYALVLAAGLALPALFLFAVATDDMIDSFSCLWYLPANRRLAGYILAIAAFVVAFPVSYIAFQSIPGWLNAKRNAKRFAKPKLPVSFDVTRKNVLVCAGIIIVFWIPYFVMYFPGITTYFDSIAQLAQFLCPPPTYSAPADTFVDADFINDSPLLDTLVFGSFVWIGRQLGSDAAGLFVYCLVQACAIAVVQGYAVCYLKKLGLPRCVCWVALAFVCLIPLVPRAAFALIKDSFFSLWFMAYMLMYIEVFRTRGKAFKRRRFLVLFVVISCLCGLTKATGIYIVTISALALLIAVKGVRLQSVCVTVIPYLVCVMVVPALVFPVLNVGRTPHKGVGITGGTIMYQQCIGVLKEHPAAYSQEERRVLNGVLDVDYALRAFDPTMLDGAALAARSNVSDKQRSDFISLWRSTVARYPVECFATQLRVSGTMIIPSRRMVQEQGIRQDGIDYCAGKYARIGTYFHFDAENPAATHSIADTLEWTLYSFWGVVPGTSLLLTSGLYGGWIPWIALIAVLYARKRDAWALAPVIITMLILFASPSSLARYLTPSLFVVFPVVGWALHAFIEQRDAGELDAVARTERKAAARVESQIESKAAAGVASKTERKTDAGVESRIESKADAKTKSTAAAAEVAQRISIASPNDSMR